MLPYTPYSQMQLQQALSYQQQLSMERIRMGLSSLSSPYGSGYPPLDPSGFGFRSFDPRGRFVQEEPKPQHSYIGLIAMAILSSPDKKLVLSDIYQWILDNYPYFRARGPGWRNSIRHNLSLNDCFIKSGRSANGKGHYWAIHPANVEDFKKGDFRRRRAQRKVRKAMGLSVPDEDEDDDDTPCSSPLSLLTPHQTLLASLPVPQPYGSPDLSGRGANQSQPDGSGSEGDNSPVAPPSQKRRLFDMDSLLAPDVKKPKMEPTDRSCDSESPKSGQQQIHPAMFGNPFLPAGFSLQSGSQPQFPCWPFGPISFPMKPTQTYGNPAWMAPFINCSPERPDIPDVRSSPSPNSADRWRETFAKIMAKSYGGAKHTQLGSKTVLEPSASQCMKLMAANISSSTPPAAN